MSEAASPIAPLRNLRLLVAYDGTHFAGWQVQPDKRTVQGEVEKAIRDLTGEDVRVLSAGRTDSGVHALGQVVSFRSNFPVPPDKWRPALQARLPEDVIIKQSELAPPDFHATFSATSKRYRYVIHNSLVSDPFIGRYSWRVSLNLDHRAMHDAGQQLVGTHDFRSFESDWPNKATSVRTVTHLSVKRYAGCHLFQPNSMAEVEETDDERAPLICLEIEADGFLYNMVRAITGTLLYVGRGTWSKADVLRILQAQDRSIAGATAPAQGLFMVRVHYPDNPFQANGEQT